MLFCALSGVLTGITFVYKNLCFFNLITLIPFIYSLKDGKKGFMKGFLYAICLNMITMSFLFNMHPMEFMGLTGIKSLLTVFIMYSGVLLLEGLIGGIFVFLYLRFIKNIWMFPVFYVVFEIITGAGEFGLTFSHLYLPWYKNIAFIQSANIFGSAFLSFIIVFVNTFIYKLAETKKIRYLCFAILIIFVNITYGAIRLNLYNNESFKYNVALVQGNFSSLEKWQTGSLRDSFKVYSDLTLQAKEKYDVDLVVWPETVINTEVYKGSYWYNQLQNFAKETEIDLVAGCFFSDKDNYYNSLVGFSKEGKQYSDIYHKRHLIPLAENEYNPSQRLKEGKRATVLNTEYGKIGALICIDSAYPYLSYKTNKNAPDYFVVATNDSWFGDSFGVENHFAHSVFRAVENNKYLLRAGNTGITAVITPVGRIEGKIEPLKRGYTVVKKGEVTDEKE